MASFSVNNETRTPFGKNEYRRSTRDLKYESYSFAQASMPDNVTVDGTPRKVLQPGTVIAKITSGADAGKVGVFQAGATDGRQTAANIVGVNDTFLPWQLNDDGRGADVEIAVCYEGALKAAWCLEHDAGGAQIALSGATQTAIEGASNLALLFK